MNALEGVGELSREDLIRRLAEVTADFEQARGCLAAVASSRPDSAFSAVENVWRRAAVRAVEANGWLPPAEAAGLRARVKAAEDERDTYLFDGGKERELEAAKKERDELRTQVDAFKARHAQVRAAVLANVNSVIDTVKAASSPRDPGHAAWDEACDTIREVLTDGRAESPDGDG